MANKTELPSSPNKKIEELDAAEQAALAELRTNLPDFISEIKIFDRFGLRKIEISFANISHKVVPWETRAFYNRFKETLAKHGLEKGRLQSSGSEREVYLLNKTTVDGKTNWRRWLRYPEQMSPEIISLLDVMSEDIGQQPGLDDADKFCRFVKDAAVKGLITQEESRSIMNELHRAENI